MADSTSEIVSPQIARANVVIDKAIIRLMGDPAYRIAHEIQSMLAVFFTEHPDLDSFADLIVSVKVTDRP